MVNNEQNVQVSDTTGDAARTIACHIIINNRKLTIDNFISQLFKRNDEITVRITFVRHAIFF